MVAVGHGVETVFPLVKRRRAENAGSDPPLHLNVPRRSIDYRVRANDWGGSWKDEPHGDDRRGRGEELVTNASKPRLPNGEVIQTWFRGHY